MSVVTDVVVALPSEFEDVEHLGRTLLKAYRGTRGLTPLPDEGFEPLDDEVSGGGKVPCGTVFWLGLNHAHMDEIIEILDADEKCHGAWLWWQTEDGAPSTHRVGAS